MKFISREWYFINLRQNNKIALGSETKWYMQKIPSVTGIICAKCKNYNICL